jgi:hypothetical protein
VVEEELASQGTVFINGRPLSRLPILFLLKVHTVITTVEGRVLKRMIRRSCVAGLAIV